MQGYSFVRKHHVICRPERKKKCETLMEKQVVSFPTSCADTKGLDPSEKVSGEDTILQTKDE